MQPFTVPARGTAPLVLDGGLATELEARGHDLSDALWSARLLADDPGAIRDVHTAFFRAGARVATSASYQASFDGFAARGIDRAAAEKLMLRSVALAVEARDALDALDATETTHAPHAGQTQAAPDDRPPRWVAASVGPYGAFLADGSEYRGRYGLTAAELAAWHRPRLEVLASAGPDVLALETIPDATEAEALVTAVTGLGVPAWLSYTIDGDRTRAGQPLAEAFAVARYTEEIVAVGVNCSDPRDVAAAIAVAAEHSGKPVIVYPNSGEGWDAARRSWTGTSRVDADHVRTWISAGAGGIGGCCRVFPADIADIAAATASAGSQGPQD